MELFIWRGLVRINLLKMLKLVGYFRSLKDYFRCIEAIRVA